MKKVFLIIAIFSGIAVVAQSNNAFTVEGNFSKVRSGKIYLTIFGENSAIKDSADIVNGKFTFRGSAEKPTIAYLSFKKMDGSFNNNLYSFYVEPAKMFLSGEGDSLKNVLLTGSKLNDDSKVLKNMMKDVTAWEDKNGKLYDEAEKVKNQQVMDSLDDMDMEVLMAKRKIVSDFVHKYPSSIRGAMAVEENYGYYAEADEVAPLYAVMAPEVKNSASGINVKNMLDVYKTVAVGMPAPDIKQMDTSGNLVSLSSLKGKIVLVDFWASWCGPCRKENPNVVKAYNQYKGKGFEIFGVSYDTKRDRWIGAINKDQLTWLHASDLQGWKNASSVTYYIKAIPSNVLVGKDGKIIGKNLLGKKLYDKLAEVMK